MRVRVVDYYMVRIDMCMLDYSIRNTCSILQPFHYYAFSSWRDVASLSSHYRKKRICTINVNVVTHRCSRRQAYASSLSSKPRKGPFFPPLDPEDEPPPAPPPMTEGRWVMEVSEGGKWWRKVREGSDGGEGGRWVVEVWRRFKWDGLRDGTKIVRVVGKVGYVDRLGW